MNERPTFDPERPWLGLRSFDEKARQLFFGRDNELRDLFERIQHRPLTILFGQSGFGKTSLLQAGLCPRLREAGFLPLILRLRYEPGDPLPGERLHAALRELRPFAPGGEVPSLWMLLHDPTYGFCGSTQSEEAARPVLILDQFEEIFTLGRRHEGAAENLLAALATIVENRPPDDLDARLAADDELALRLHHEAQPVRVVLSLREDFLHLLERWKRSLPTVMENRVELRLLTGEQAFQATVAPGRLRTLVPGSDAELQPIVSDATGAAIVRFVAGAGSDVPLAEIDAVPPLLSLLCTELNEKRLAAADSQIRAESLAGRAEDILGDFYERSLALHPPEVGRFVEDRLLSEGGFRQPVNEDSALSELSAQSLNLSQARDVLDQLVDDRLLVVEERGGLRRVELTHDILCRVALRSRTVYRERSAKERAEREDAVWQAQKAREALELRERAERARLRRGLLVSVLLAIGCLTGAILGYRGMVSAKEQKELADKNREAAEASSTQAELNRAKMEAAEATTQKSLRELEVSDRNRRLQVAQAARNDVLAAQALYQRGDRSTAFAQVARALELDSSCVEASYTAAAFLNEANTVREGVNCDGHQDAITGLGCHPNGSQIATSSKDGTVRIWDRTTGRQLGKSEEGLPSAQLSYSLDGRYLCLSSGSQVRILHSADSSVKRIFELPGKVTLFAVSADSQFLLAGTAENSLRIWKIDASEKERLLPLGGQLSGAAFSPDGKQLVVCSLDKTARIFQVEDGKQVKILAHAQPVSSAAYSPDGSEIVTVSNDGSACLWEVASGRAYDPVISDVATAAYSPDGSRLLLAKTNLEVWVWEPRTGALLKLANSLEGSVHPSLAWSPDGQMVATSGSPRVTYMDRMDSGPLLGSASATPARWVAFTPDGLELAVGESSGSVRLWSVTRRESFGVQLEPPSVRQANTERPVAIRPEPRPAAAKSEEKPVKGKGPRYMAVKTSRGKREETGAAQVMIWDTENQQLVGNTVYDVKSAPASGSTAKFDSYNATYVDQPRTELLPAGSEIVSTDGTKCLLLKGTDCSVWDVRSRRLSATIKSSDVIEYAGFSPRGDSVLTVTGGRIILTQLAEKSVIAFGRERSATGARFSPDGESIVSSDWSGEATLWRSRTGKKLVSFDLGSKQNDFRAQFTPDGRAIVTTSSRGIFAVWGLDGTQQVSYSAPGGAIIDAKFTHGGKMVTASADMALRQWDWMSGRQLGKWQGKAKIISLALESDGPAVLVVDASGETRIWDPALDASFLGLIPGSNKNAIFGLGRKFVLGSTGGEPVSRVWDAAAGKLLVKLPRIGLGGLGMTGGEGALEVFAAGKSVAVWTLPTLEAASAPAWLSAYLRYRGEAEFDDEGLLRTYTEVGRREARVKLAALLQASPKQTFFSQIAHWSLRADSERPWHPFRSQTNAQHAEESIQPGAPAITIGDAYRRNPNDPLIHLALAESEPNRRRADYLRELTLGKADRLTPRQRAAAGGFLSRQIDTFSPSEAKKRLAWFDLALQQDPEDSLAWSAKARLQFKLGELPAATAAWKEALRREPKNASWHVLAAVVAQRERRKVDAEAHVLAAKALPENPESDNAFGWLALVAGDLPEAVRRFEKSGGLPNAGDASVQASNLRGLALATWKGGKQQEARAFYARLVALEPGWRNTENTLGFGRELGGTWEAEFAAVHASYITSFDSYNAVYVGG